MITSSLVSRPRAWGLPVLPLLLALAWACATEGPPQRSSGASTSEALRGFEGPRHEVRGRSFAGWDPLLQSLAQTEGGGPSCPAVKEDRHEQGLALVLSATCLFPRGTTVAGSRSPVIAVIAAELTAATDREFWIAAAVPARSAPVSAPPPSEQVATLVRVLIAAGVPANRLVALMGLPDGADAGPSRLAGTPLADVPTLEIVAVPVLGGGR